MVSSKAVSTPNGYILPAQLGAIAMTAMVPTPPFPHMFSSFLTSIHIQGCLCPIIIVPLLLPLSFTALPLMDTFFEYMCTFPNECFALSNSLRSFHFQTSLCYSRESYMHACNAGYALHSSRASTTQHNHWPICLVDLVRPPCSHLSLVPPTLLKYQHLSSQCNLILLINGTWFIMLSLVSSNISFTWYCSPIDHQL